MRKERRYVSYLIIRIYLLDYGRVDTEILLTLFYIIYFICDTYDTCTLHIVTTFLSNSIFFYPLVSDSMILEYLVITNRLPTVSLNKWRIFLLHGDIFILRASARAWSDHRAIFAKWARRCWKRMPANGQKRPPRGWSCRSSNRPREIDHLALLLHPPPLRRTLFLRIPRSCEIPSLPPSLSACLPLPRFHYPPSCSLYYRTAAQASPYIVNMSGTSKRARAPSHARTRMPARMIVGVCFGVRESTIAPAMYRVGV